MSRNIIDNWRNLCESFWDARYSCYLAGSDRFSWMGEEFTFETMGLRDASFYICSQAFIANYNMPVQTTKTDKDGYKGYQDRLVNWCKRKAVEDGINPIHWALIRERIKINARDILEVMGDKMQLCTPDEFQNILSGTAFILFCEKEDSGKKIQREMMKRGYRCKMVLSKGLPKGYEELLLAEIQQIISAGENYWVISLHDNDVGGGKIYNVLKQYVPRIIDGGINDEFWEFKPDLNFMDYAGQYTPEENAVSYLEKCGYHLKYTDYKVELPVLILRRGASDIVDYIEYKIKGLPVNLFRINVPECKPPKIKPKRLISIEKEVKNLSEEIYPERERERRFRVIRENLEREMGDTIRRKREELDRQIALLKNFVKANDEYFEEKEIDLYTIRAEMQEKVVGFWMRENESNLSFDWQLEANLVKDAFHQWHSAYTGDLLSTTSSIEGQNKLLNHIVDNSRRNKSILNELNVSTTEFTCILSVLNNLKKVSVYINWLVKVGDYL